MKKDSDICEILGIVLVVGSVLVLVAIALTESIVVGVVLSALFFAGSIVRCVLFRRLPKGKRRNYTDALSFRTFVAFHPYAQAVCWLLILAVFIYFL